MLNPNNHTSRSEYRIILSKDFYNREVFKVQKNINTLWDDIRNIFFSLLYRGKKFDEYSTWETFTPIFDSIDKAKYDILQRQWEDTFKDISTWKEVK